MIRSLHRYIALEIFGLWVFEFVVSALFLYLILSTRLIFDNNAELNAHEALHPFLCCQAILCTLTVSLFAVATGLYHSDICLRCNRITVFILMVTLFLAILLATVNDLAGSHLRIAVNRRLFDIFSVWIACLVVMRVAFLFVLQSDLFARKVLVVGSSQSARRIQNVINTSGGQFCQLIGNVVVSAKSGDRPALSAFDITELRGQKIWGVVLAKDAAQSLPRDGFLKNVMSLKQFRGAYVFDEAGFCEDRLQRLDLDALSQDMLSQDWQNVVATVTAQRWTHFAYRSLDVIISVALLILTLPLCATVAAAIRLETAGPIFCSQPRVGQHGKIFTFRKFRCHVTSTKDGRPASVRTLTWQAQNHPILTKVGRFIRSTHIDELPQLLNVISGEMSFIGPRPEQPHRVETLSKLIPYYGDRVCLRPGMTGWAQVKHLGGANVEDARLSLAYDLFYIKHRSLLLQLMIIAATLRMLLFKQGMR